MVFSILLGEYSFKQSQNRKWRSFTKVILSRFTFVFHCYCTQWYTSQIEGLITYAHFLNDKCNIRNILLESEKLCSLRLRNCRALVIWVNFFFIWNRSECSLLYELRHMDVLPFRILKKKTTITFSFFLSEKMWKKQFH